MRRSRISLMVGCVGIFIFVPAGHAQAAAGSSAMVFETNCSVCHGDDGGGSAVGKTMNAPDLRSSKVRVQSNTALARFIREGNGAMPAFKDRLDAKQIGDLVRYVKSLPKPGAGKTK